MTTRDEQVKRAKKAIDRMDRATRPVVHKIVELAQTGVAQASAALDVASANIDKIADAAVDVASTQTDLAGTPGTPRSHTRKDTKRG
jgi:hypothetical protein